MFSQLFEVILEVFKLNLTLILIIVLLPLWYLYITRNHDYWTKRGVPGPKPLPYFGNSLDNLFHKGAELEIKYFEKYGKVYGTFDGNKPVLFVADPLLVKLIAVKEWHTFINRGESGFIDPAFSKGLGSLRDDKWKSVRAVMSPTFTSGKIRRMMELMKECLKGVMDNLDSAAVSQSEVDIKKLFGAYTIDVIARCAFATKTDAHKNPNDPFLRNVREILELKPLRLIVVSLLPKFIRQAFDIDFATQSTRAFFKNVSYKLLKQRKEGNEKRNDFLQFLIEAENEKSNLESDLRDLNEGHFTNENKDDVERQARALLKGASGAKLTDEEAMAQVFLFFLVGYETTNALLTYASCCLSVNPENQQKLYEELRTVFDNNKDISYEELNRLEYLNAVISETLRLYPPLMKLDREAKEDFSLGETGIRISKGTRIFLGFYALHHDKDNFEEPNAFKPERFLKENLHLIRPYTYLPFGAGPRNCIGMRFALAEAKLALAKVVLNYKLVPTNKTALKFTFHPVMMQCSEVLIKVEKR